MVLINKSKLLEGLKKLKQNLSASPIVVIEDVESLVESLEVKEVEEDADKYLSEEDESRMDNLHHFLEEYGNQYYGHLTLQGTISWLKSLRPQNHWKPSDEQMETLELIINSHSLDAYHLGMVQHLYNGLKTLKE